jgi:hypothetical protein
MKVLLTAFLSIFVILVVAIDAVRDTVPGVAANQSRLIRSNRHLEQSYVSDPPFIFTERPVEPGTIAEQEAITIALRNTSVAPLSKMASGATITARFGTFADTSYTDRSAWVISFAGPGISIAPTGPAHLPGRMQAQVAPPMDHNESVILDAKTGLVIEIVDY